MSAALLEIENLTKSFGGVDAVRNCTFSVPEGQVTGLIGPNGAGKSTVVDLVSGFGRPDSGSVRFAGKPIVGQRPDVISRLGLIRTFQTPREWRQLTVMDNVLLARLMGLAVSWCLALGRYGCSAGGGCAGCCRSHPRLEHMNVTLCPIFGVESRF